MIRLGWVVTLATTLAAAGCLIDQDEFARCEPSRHQNDNADCGCQGPCPEGAVCHGGGCCVVAQHAADPFDCGCRGPVPAGHFCVDGIACDPTLHGSDSLNCGCTGPCPEQTRCMGGACQCDPQLSRFNDANCGCQGPCQTTSDTCAAGICACDPAKHLMDDGNCGCEGPCLAAQSCQWGRCVCADDEVLCDGGCESKTTSTCLCDPDFHANDASNCGCAGPCVLGQACTSGVCQCSPIAHTDDATNCGCNGPCVPGQVCVSGQCVCPTGMMWCAAAGGGSGVCSLGPCCAVEQHLGDDANCGCMGPCPSGLSCTLGACDKCDVLENLANSKNCGCQGACKSDELCDAGQCVCKPELFPCLASVGPFAGSTICNPQPADAYCADCMMACPGGDTCSVKPNKVASDYAWTGQAIFQCCGEAGCCAQDCGPMASCIGGVCTCKPGFETCIAGDTLFCVAAVNAKSLCSDCLTVCSSGVCTPTSTGGQACCTASPEGGSICCSTLADGTQACCTSAEGMPNGCL